MADRTVVYRLQADVAGFEANMRNAAASTKKLAGDLTSMDKDAQRTRQGLTTLGDSAGKAGLVAAAGLGATIKAAIDWESAFAGVQKTVEGTVPQMAALEEELRGLAKTMPATHQEIAATAEAAGQLGIAREDVAKFTETMLQLGETTNLSAEDAAVQLARFSNIMGTSSNDVDKLGASVVGLGNNFATTEAEVVELGLRMAAAGRQAGLTEADVFGVAAALTSVGVEAEAGGTAFSKVFTSIGDSVRSESPKLETFASAAGMTADEFARLYENDPTEAIGAFVEGMGDIAREGGNTSEIFKSLGLTDQRLMRAVLSVGSATGSWAEATGLANEEFAKGTALTDEYAKRAETTGAKATVAWNNIRDAAIEVGDVMLPIVAKTAEGVAAMASAFGDLPGPIKGAVGPLLGLTAIVGGGTWFTARAIRSVADTRDALDKLGVSGGKAAKGLKGLSIAGGIAVGIGTLAGAVTELSNSMAETLPGSEELRGRLIDLAAVGEGFSVTLGPEFDSLGDSVDRLTNPSRLQRLNDWSIGFNDAILPGDQYADGAAREAVREIEALDAELANLASSGNAEIAAIALERVLSTLSADQGKELLDLLPQYDEALEGAANEAKLSAAASDDASGAVEGLGGAFGEATDEAEDFGDVLDRLNERLSGRADMRDYQAAIDDFTDSIKENGRTFDINTEKGRNNQAALDNIAGSVLKVADNMKGAAREKFLTGAINDIRTMGERMGIPKSEIKTLIGLLREANNADVKPNVDVNAGEALTAIERVRVALAGIKDKSVTVRVTRTGASTADGGFGPQANAAGGYISGPGTGTSDSIPAYLSNGEYVIKAAAVQKYGIKTFDRLNAMHFAEGGSVDKKRKITRGVAFYAEDNTTSLERALDRLRMVAENQTEALDAATAKQDFWAKRMGDVSSATVSAFNTNLFDRSSDPWASGAGGGAIFNLSQDIAGLNERAGLQRQLAGMGLSGDSLAELLKQGSNADISNLISSGQVSQYADLYAQRAALQGSVGMDAGQLAFGDAFASAARETARAADAAESTNRRIASLERQLERNAAALERMERTAPERTGRAAGKAVRDAAVDANRDKKNRTGVRRG